MTRAAAPACTATSRWPADEPIRCRAEVNMNAFAWKLVTPLLTCTFALAAAAVARAQEDAAAKPDLKKEVKEFKSALADRKGEKDQDATKMIGEWIARWEDLGEKERTEIVKTLDLVFRAKRPPEQGGLYKATVVALGRMDKEGAQVLKKAFDNKQFDDKEWLALRADMLKQIGRAKDEGMVKFLVETATRSHEDPLMAAAGDALGNYGDADQKLRKEIYKDLYRKYIEIYEAAMSLDLGDATAQRKKQTLAAIADPWNSTLGKLSGQSFRDARQWQDYWNDHKSDDWNKGK